MTVGGAVLEWWRLSLGRDDGGTRAARARLRRCNSPAEVLAISETHDLNRHLQTADLTATSDQLALLTTIFAALNGTDGEKLATQFGKKEGKDSPPKLSELRFQSLIRVRSRKELMVPLRRCLAILGPNPVCNGYALAEDLYFWSDEVRNRWCFQYFGAEYAKTGQKEADK